MGYLLVLLIDTLQDVCHRHLFQVIEIGRLLGDLL